MATTKKTKKTTVPHAQAAVPATTTAPTAAVADHPAKTCTFRGIRLALPEELPGVVMWDLASMQGGDGFAVFRLLQAVVGEEQFLALRNTLAGEQDLVAALNELLPAVLEPFGVEFAADADGPAAADGGGEG